MRVPALLPIAAVAALLLAPAELRAQDFYRGKSLTILVGNAPGGGFDANARLLSRHIGRHIPGNPNSIVVNMPGAGGLTAMQHLDLNAPKDGSWINHFNFGLIGEAKLNPERVRIDWRKYAWIGSIGADVSVCYVYHRIPARGLEDLKRYGPLHFGMTAPGTSNDLQAKIAKRVFGLDIRQVSGYPGSAEHRLAIERGELDGSCGAWGSVPAEWIEGGKIHPFYKALPLPQEGLPADIPYAGDIAPDERARAIIELLTASGEVGRPFIAAAAVPPERLAILRRAFDAAMQDPLLIADAEKLRLPVTPRNADAAERIMARIYATPEEVTAAARKLMEE